MSIAIKVENLSKKYIIQHEKKTADYETFSESLIQGSKNLANKIIQPFTHTEIAPHTQEEFWALKDINFEINQGDKVGIIGRNGAGKSTLLKVLSRITEPTSGKVHINGRIASLLEVGTGFHPELTGRENIFLNGAILGMSRKEIKLKFDEIVAFAEVEKFLDTPVKRYSSGMYVRLAFAVAAHLESDILVIDEVLAVGDIQFQKKCLGKMGEVSKEGRTVLFVSHNLSAIKQLCNKGVLLRQGVLGSYGNTEDVIKLYLQDSIKNKDNIFLKKEIDSFPEDPDFRMTDVVLSQCGKKVEKIVQNGAPLEVTIKYQVKNEIIGLRIFVDMLDSQETILFRSFHDENHAEIVSMMPGYYESKLTIPSGILAPFQHFICVKSGVFGIRYTTPEVGVRIPIEVEHTSNYNRAYPGDKIVGCLALSLNWNIEGLRQ